MKPAGRIVARLDIDNGLLARPVALAGARVGGDPLDAARRCAEAGAGELLLIDVHGTAASRRALQALVRRMAGALDVPLATGGGLRCVDDIQRMLDAGADKAAIKSAATREPGLLAEAAARCGSRRLVAAIDARRAPRELPPRWQVCTYGGRVTTRLHAVAWARALAVAGAGEILLNAADHQATRNGLDLELLQAVTSALNVPVIAAGGVATLDHLLDGLIDGGADAVLVDGAFGGGEAALAAAKAHPALGGEPARAVEAAG